LSTLQPINTDMLKRLFTQSESQANERLSAIVEVYGAHVYPKVRLADVFRIERSGIRRELYSFALKAHFDFLITDDAPDPLFAVELDGESHRHSRQRQRDRLKNQLSDHFGLPLLRVTARHLQFRVRGVDLLAWFVHSWFAQRFLSEMQDGGQLPSDEPFFASDLFLSPALEGDFPLQLGLEARRRISQLSDRERWIDPAPSHIIGFDNDGNAHVFAWLRVAKQSWLSTQSAARAQHFPVMLSDLVCDLAAIDIADQLAEYLRGARRSRTDSDIDSEIARFSSRFRIGESFGFIRDSSSLR